MRRVRVRVRVEFVMEIPGEEVPSPTGEAVEAAALAIAGPPFEILPGASVVVEPDDDVDRSTWVDTWVASSRSTSSRGTAR
jgi:hypothetical protein